MGYDGNKGALKMAAQEDFEIQPKFNHKMELWPNFEKRFRAHCSSQGLGDIDARLCLVLALEVQTAGSASLVRHVPQAGLRPDGRPVDLEWMLVQYRAVFVAERARHQLSKVRQGKREGVLDYFYRFRGIFRRARPHMSWFVFEVSAEGIGRFLRGLRSPVSEARAPTTMKEALSMAMIASDDLAH